MKKIILWAVFFLVFLPSALAAEKGTYTIKGIGVSDVSHSMFINVVEEITQTTCSKNKTFRFKKSGESEKIFREILALLMTAKVTNSKVVIAYDPIDCYHDASILKYVYLP